MKRFPTVLLAFSLFVAAAASAQTAPRGEKKAAPAKQTAKVAATIADPEVIDAAGFAELVAKQRGKRVMVNFWATWCEPCREEFPMVNELAQKYAAQGLVVLGVSLDDDGELPMVRRFLGRVNPVFHNYRKKPGNEEAFINAIDRRWSGAIPATFFYAPDGQRVGTLVGEHKREEFEKAIQELLARPAPR